MTKRFELNDDMMTQVLGGNEIYVHKDCCGHIEEVEYGLGGDDPDSYYCCEKCGEKHYFLNSFEYATFVENTY